MSVKDLFIQAPHLCGAANAEKHAKIAKLVWDFERNENGFPKVDDESPDQRIAFLFDWPCENEEKKSYIQYLAQLAVLRHYEKEHGDVVAGDEADILAVSLSELEPMHLDVAAVLTVAEANIGWWGQ